MPRKPQVSILLPARNAEATLAAALASLAEQTLGDFECLIVDDASQDNTVGIAQAWAAQDPRYRVLCQITHRGIVAALNWAAAEARAPFLARQDADDLSRPERLARTLALLESDPRLGAVACLVEQFPAASLHAGLRRYCEWLNELRDPAAIALEIWVESPLPHPAVIMRRSAFEEASGYADNPWPEDYNLWLAMHLAGWRFAKVAEVLYDWRHHDARLTFTDPRYSPAAFLACKLHHLKPALIDRSLVIWGAGRDGRRLARALHERGIDPSAFIDIDPRKIGHQRFGVPVHPPEILNDREHLGPAPLVLVAVGTRGARKLIRRRLAAMGWEEPTEFLCLH